MLRTDMGLTNRLNVAVMESGRMTVTPEAAVGIGQLCEFSTTTWNWHSLCEGRAMQDNSRDVG